MDGLRAEIIAQTRNMQQERQQRGNDFQDEIRQSWHLVRGCWRMAIESGKGSGQSSGTRPADAVTILRDVNLLTELKRTAGDSFKLGMLRPSQLKGLVDFDEILPRNFGLVFLSFLNEKKRIDEAYSFRIIDGLRFMKPRGRTHIKLAEFRNEDIPCLNMPCNGSTERLYDLQGVNDYYSSYRK